MSSDPYAPLAAVVRNGRRESLHSGAFIALAADGAEVAGAGDPDAPLLPRSAWKPLQAVAMVRAGLSLPPELLAVVCSSHSGTALHTDAVREVLRRNGLGEESLANAPDVPLGAHLRHEVAPATVPSRLSANCSGKHAGMLATCQGNGWSWADGDYLRPAHPLQQGMRDVTSELTGAQAEVAGPDGCGAPTIVSTLRALASGYRAIALGEPGTAERAVFDAMAANPEMCAGPGRVATDLMQAVPQLIAKDGAEGVFAAAAADGRALALKVADGSTRPWRAVLAHLLDRLGLDAAAFRPTDADVRLAVR